MHLDTLLASLRRVEPTPHIPDFRLSRELDSWRVYDGARALALCRPSSLDIWAFSPFDPDEMANPEPPGDVVDIHTVHNTYINFGYQTWPTHWHGSALIWNWLRVAGPELEAEITLSAPHGEYSRWRLTIGYDATQARYRYQVAIAARKKTPDGFEAFNLMAPGALAESAERRRWTHTMWENPDGGLRRLVHSSLLLLGTDYATGGMKAGRKVHGMQSGPWRHRNLPYPRAWVAYAGHASFNPALLIHQTSVPLRGATCDLLFDEHLFWNTAGQDNLADDGYFHYRMTLEIVNPPAPLMRNMLAQATDPVRPAHWRNEQLALPFYLDRTNLFDTPVDPWEPEECALFLFPKATAGTIAWDEAGRNGSRSLRLQTAVAGETIHLLPKGAVCRVRPHARCRLSAWLRTAGPSAQARLLLQAYAYSYSNILNSVTSAPVTGATEWTRVSIELDSGIAAYVMPRLELTGPGTAWFAELQLETSITEPVESY